MHVSVCKYIINTVYLVHVSATEMTILGDALQKTDTSKYYKSLWTIPPV